MSDEYRKEEEVRHYDVKAREWSARVDDLKWRTDVHGVPHDIFSSYQFCEFVLQAHCRSGRQLLDFGCGTGIHAILPAQYGVAVTGIDLSRDSLTIARERAARAGVAHATSFVEMDCENIDFPAKSFDVIFDGGTFSSIDLQRALPGILRSLKKDGVLIGIETFGHNPLFNLKRRMNELRGSRTSWAAQHIVRMGDLERLRDCFARVEAHFFHLTSMLLVPFLGWSWVHPVFRAAEKIDAVLLRLPFLQRYAFKVVFVCSGPKHLSGMTAE